MSEHKEPAWSQANVDVALIATGHKPPQISKPIRVVTK